VTEGKEILRKWVRKKKERGFTCREKEVEDKRKHDEEFKTAGSKS
jgi:hypothetical protein